MTGDQVKSACLTVGGKQYQVEFDRPVAAGLVRLAGQFMRGAVNVDRREGLRRHIERSLGVGLTIRRAA